MTIRIQHEGYALPVSQALTNRFGDDISQSLSEKSLEFETISAITLNYRDPTYSDEKGGYHPVEVRVIPPNSKHPEWRISYITSFAYVGIPPYAELDKWFDFDFEQGVTQIAYQGVFAIEITGKIFQLWQSNFLAYADAGVFNISASID